MPGWYWRYSCYTVLSRQTLITSNTPCYSAPRLEALLKKCFKHGAGNMVRKKKYEWEVERTIILITQFLLPNYLNYCWIRRLLSQQKRKKIFFNLLSSILNKGKNKIEVKINITLLQLYRKSKAYCYSCPWSVICREDFISLWSPSIWSE